jgi:hypothetical protein
LRQLFPEVTSFALRTRPEKLDEAPIYIYSFMCICIYKVTAALCMLNAICDYSSCGSKFLADDADTHLQTKRKQLPTLARKALSGALATDQGDEGPKNSISNTISGHPGAYTVDNGPTTMALVSDTSSVFPLSYTR